jgi:hypothetical protein
MFYLLLVLCNRIQEYNSGLGLGVEHLKVFEFSIYIWNFFFQAWQLFLNYVGIQQLKCPS